MTITAYANGKFRARVRLKGQYFADTFDTREEAESFEILKTAEILRLQSKAVRDKNPDLTFSAALDLYFASTTFTNKRPFTQAGERPKAKSLLKYFGDKPVSLISSFDIQDYFDFRATQPSYFNDNETVRSETVSANTIRLEKVQLSNLYKFLNQRGRTEHNPIKGFSFELPRVVPDATPISDAVLYKMFKSYKFLEKYPMFDLWFFTTLYTGMRSGEVARLELDFFDEEQEGFDIPARAFKNNNPHFVNLDHELLPRISQQVQFARANGSKYIFFSKSPAGDFIPLNYSYYWRIFKEDAGIVEKLRPHQMRHTFITFLVNYSKMSIPQMMSVTGHQSYAAFKRYVHLLNSQFRDVLTDVSEVFTGKFIDMQVAEYEAQLQDQHSNS